MLVEMRKIRGSHEEGGSKTTYEENRALGGIVARSNAHGRYDWQPWWAERHKTKPLRDAQKNSVLGLVLF